MEILDFDEPLTEDVLNDANSPQVCNLLYLYSMEPPFYAYVHNACLSRDQ